MKMELSNILKPLQKTKDMEEEKKLTPRPKQTNCQHEPPYPDHETVVFSIRFPDDYLHESENGCEARKWKDLK